MNEEQRGKIFPPLTVPIYKLLSKRGIKQQRTGPSMEPAAHLVPVVSAKYDITSQLN